MDFDVSEDFLWLVATYPGAQSDCLEAKDSTGPTPLRRRSVNPLELPQYIDFGYSCEW